MTAAISTIDTATSQEAAKVLTHDLTMASNLVSGDLLLSVVGIGSNGFLPNVDQPDGWVMLMNFSGVNVFQCVFAKISDGTESGVTFTTGLAATSSHITFRITGWSGDLDGVNVSNGTTENSTAPDPASLTVSWDDTDNLFIPICAAHRNAVPSVFPAGYVDNQVGVSNGTGGDSAMVAACSQDIVALTEDPGAFTIGESRRWAAATIGIAAATEVFTDPPIGNRLGIKIGIGI